MNTPRFFVPPEAIRGDRVYFAPDQAHQIYRVLRLRPDQVVYVLDNRGNVYTVRLDRVTRGEVVGRIVDRREATGEPPLRITLYQALLKGEKMDWVLQKGTEVGVHTFVPLLTRRSVVRRREHKPRWERILREAAEQSGRAFIPRLAPVHTWEEALAAIPSFPLCLLAHPAEEAPPLREVVREGGVDSVGVFVGPEGGFTEEEVRAAVERGCRPVRLGPRILRAETAAVVIVTLLLHRWGDIG